MSVRDDITEVGGVALGAAAGVAFGAVSLGLSVPDADKPATPQLISAAQIDGAIAACRQRLAQGQQLLYVRGMQLQAQIMIREAEAAIQALTRQKMGPAGMGPRPALP